MQSLNRIHRTLAIASLPAFLALSAAGLSAEETKLNFGGAGWMQYSTIMKSSDTTNDRDMDHRYLVGSGAQFSINVNPSEQLRIEAGIGVGAGHNLAATTQLQGGYAPFGAGPYVSNANFKYSFWSAENSGLFVRGGLFPYDYNPEAQNLGLYLLRGPVYPGFIISGFETKAVLPVANTLGLQVHHQAGGFQHDFLFTFETEFYPYWDMSPAYIASYNFGSALRIGAGVNFYHLIAADSKLTRDTSKISIDTIGAGTATPVFDTTIIPFSGTKVMANASFDIKSLFGGAGKLGAEDLKLYTEVAIIGLDNGKAYKKNYGPYSDRMPIMVGFNLPAFGFLERLSFEVESYKAHFIDDYSKFNHYSNPTPIPPSPLDTNYADDNIKWSLYGSKVIKDHIKFSFQLASDHYRPGIFRGYGDNNAPSNEAILFRPSDWYWTTKLAYFF